MCLQRRKDEPQRYVSHQLGPLHPEGKLECVARSDGPPKHFHNFELSLDAKCGLVVMVPPCGGSRWWRFRTDVKMHKSCPIALRSGVRVADV